MNRRRPTIRQQLDAANIKKSGTALERLIRDNQDFDLLQPEEATDDAGLPLWLRVWWRKSHPDLEHPTTNPGGGYPDVLYDIHARMLRDPDQPWGSPANRTATEE
jgi:hypothetical protein